jgi:uncharacterized protein (DUF1800 family)
MNNSCLWSLRLGFSTREAEKVKRMGLSSFLDASFKYNLPLGLPKDFEVPGESDKANEGSQMTKEDMQKSVQKKFAKNSFTLKKMVLQRAFESEYPLKENIALFWHNHFVSNMRAVRNGLWIYDHYAMIHLHGTGDYKMLVRQIISSNAMIKYLNNDQNRKGKINENLGRELLELFTLGEGNYTEQDIKNTARALAGLSLGKDAGIYRPKFKDNDEKVIFGEKGNFVLDDVVDLIFKQKSTPYFITRKILKWFIYDNPPEDAVKKYGDFFKKNNFNLELLFKHIFLQEELKQSQGAMMKNPMKFAFQVMHDLQIPRPYYLGLLRFLKNQGMDIYEQVNVEGWQGGKDWLSSQTYIDRQGFVDNLITGGKGALAKRFLKDKMDNNDAIPVMKDAVDNPTNISKGKSDEDVSSDSIAFVQGKYKFDINSNAKQIIEKSLEECISLDDATYKEELSKILVYDFNPKEEGAQQNINRLYQYITKSPEFQII